MLFCCCCYHFNCFLVLSADWVMDHYDRDRERDRNRDRDRDRNGRGRARGRVREPSSPGSSYHGSSSYHHGQKRYREEDAGPSSSESYRATKHTAHWTAHSDVKREQQVRPRTPPPPQEPTVSFICYAIFDAADNITQSGQRWSYCL